jgi:hypothetical protein
MFKEDIGLVESIAREIAKEEIAKAIKELTPKVIVKEVKMETPNPVNTIKVDTDTPSKKGK